MQAAASLNCEMEQRGEIVESTRASHIRPLTDDLDCTSGRNASFLIVMKRTARVVVDTKHEAPTHASLANE
jgi:hypothetical protein